MGLIGGLRFQPLSQSDTFYPGWCTEPHKWHVSKRYTVDKPVGTATHPKFGAASIHRLSHAHQIYFRNFIPWFETGGWHTRTRKSAIPNIMTSRHINNTWCDRGSASCVSNYLQRGSPPPEAVGMSFSCRNIALFANEGHESVRPVTFPVRSNYGIWAK